MDEKKKSNRKVLNNTRITIRLPMDLKEKLEQQASKSSASVGTIARMGITAWLNQYSQNT